MLRLKEQSGNKITVTVDEKLIKAAQKTAEAAVGVKMKLLEGLERRLSTMGDDVHRMKQDAKSHARFIEVRFARIPAGLVAPRAAPL